MNVTSRQGVAEQLIARIDCNPSIINVQAHYVERLWRGNSQTFTLTDCVVCNAVMTSQKFSVRVDNFARLVTPARSARD